MGIYCCLLTLTQTCHTLVAFFSWVMAVPGLFFVFPLLQHLSIWWVYSPTLLWDPALLCWLLSCFSMVTIEISASASNCPLSSRSVCFLSWIIKFLWIACRDGHQKGLWWPSSFVIGHWGKILQNQLFLILFFAQCFPLAIPIKCFRILFCSQLPAPRDPLPEPCKDILCISWLRRLHFRISFLWEYYGKSGQFWVVKV